MLLIPNEIHQLIKQGALFVCNHSGGKDSQAMYIYLRDIVPEIQLIVIHAHLPEVDWPGVEDHARKYVQHPFFVTRAGKTFWEMVFRREKFPSPATRQCTSDLKRGPISKVIRNYANEHGFTQIVNCMGIRAQESSARAKKIPFKINEKESNSKRDWFEWYPIFLLSTDQVFLTIFSSGEEPFWIYMAGMSRTSCIICIMSSANDIRIAAKLMPHVAETYMKNEEKLNFTMTMPIKGVRKFLREII